MGDRLPGRHRTTTARDGAMTMRGETRRSATSRGLRGRERAALGRRAATIALSDLPKLERSTEFRADIEECRSFSPLEALKARPRQIRSRRRCDTASCGLRDLDAASLRADRARSSCGRTSTPRGGRIAATGGKTPGRRARSREESTRELRCPRRRPPSIQRRIAGILSAYDDLIENCERRIRVLDEMARALYREWFVLFRYPGPREDAARRFAARADSEGLGA